MTNEEEVARQYAELVARAWHDREFLERLRTNPRAVLSAHGLSIEDDAVIAVVTTRALDVTGQLALWRNGSAAGRYVLQLPMDCVRELTDEQLMSIVGGATAALRRLGSLLLPSQLASTGEPELLTSS